MDQVSFTGGARVGWVNATFPFAKLACSREKIELDTFGRYEFTPDQVVSFGTYGSIPLFANGLRIHHNRLDYPELVVFWCMGRRDRVVEEIRQTGFVPSGAAVARPTGFPIRWSVLIGYVLMWNLLFLIDMAPAAGAHGRPQPGIGAFVAFALTFALATAVKRSRRVQAVVLAPGHGPGEVKGLMTLVQLLTGALGAGLGLALLFARM
jgi:hypothetical protein